jgi:hypothetical protein
MINILPSAHLIALNIIDFKVMTSIKMKKKNSLCIDDVTDSNSNICHQAHVHSTSKSSQNWFITQK